MIHCRVCSGQAAAAFTQPSNTICMNDVRSQASTTPPFTNQYAPGVGTAANGYLDSGFSDNHSEGAVTLFADGHVKWMKQGAALSNRSMWAL